jgi:hypothetical protein
MAFKFRDLIITWVPGDIHASGCGGGSCDAGSQGTVGSCTAEGCGGHGLPDMPNCGQSDEILDPLKAYIDPPFLADLRQLLRFALKGRGPNAKALEATMKPHSHQELDKLEASLKEALTEVSHQRKHLKKG